MAQEFYSTSEARKNLSSLINQVKYQGKEFKIGRHSEVEAVLVPLKQKSKNIHERVAEKRRMQNMSIDYSSELFSVFFQSLAKKYKLKLVILFGSHGRGRPKFDSDIDLAVSAEGGLSSEDEIKLYQELIPAFGRDDIDIVNLDRVHNVTLRYNVFTGSKILFEKEDRCFKKMLIRAYFEYQDFKKHTKRKDDLLKEKISRLKQFKV